MLLAVDDFYLYRNLCADVYSHHSVLQILQDQSSRDCKRTYPVLCYVLALFL